MSLHPKPIPPVPPETAIVARAAFPKGNIYLQIRDTLGSIYLDSDFSDLFAPKRVFRRKRTETHAKPTKTPPQSPVRSPSSHSDTPSAPSTNSSGKSSILSMRQ